MIDKQKIEKAVTDFLLAIGEDPNREGLVETPKRVAKMYAEVLEGVQYTNDQIAQMFNKSFTEAEASNNIVVVKDISCFSFCEHHLALMYDMKISVGYLPVGRVLGLSKIARIADMVCKRLQLQERIGADIVEIIGKVTGTQNVIVYIEANHSCMTMRGIKKTDVKTVTLTKRGAFNDDSIKSEFLQLIGK